MLRYRVTSRCLTSYKLRGYFVKTAHFAPVHLVSLLPLLLHKRASYLRYAPAACESLKRSALAIAHRTELCQPDVAHFACIIVGPTVQFAINNKACAQTCTQCKEHHMARTAACSKLILGQSTGIGIVLKVYRDVR